jgi:hypothetical protein
VIVKAMRPNTEGIQTMKRTNEYNFPPFYNPMHDDGFHSLSPRSQLSSPRFPELIDELDDDFDDFDDVPELSDFDSVNRIFSKLDLDVHRGAPTRSRVNLGHDY